MVGSRPQDAALTLSAGQVGLLVVSAVLGFWMLGAYNRLMALRNAIGAAWQLVAATLEQRCAAAAALVAALRAPLAAEAGALDALLAACERLRAAAAVIDPHPVATAQTSAALVAAETAAASASSRVLALLALQPGLQGDPAVAPHAAAWHDTTPRLVYARQLYNEHVAAYDAAGQQFPTRLLLRLFGFGAAGRV